MKTLKRLSILLFSSLLLISCGNKHKSHTYDFEKGQWFWSETENGYAASLTVFCDKCDENTKGHKLELEANVTSNVNNPTCTENGKTIYTATVEFDGKTYENTKEIVLEASGHNYTTMVVDGEYRKTYQALEQFDDSQLSVKIICETCGHEKTLTHDDYFIVYSSFGMDYLAGGDTYVEISYYGLRKVLNDLTVNFIPNEITGFADNYTISCGSLPDFSGVSSTANDVTFAYYRDSEMTDQVEESQLSGGNYFVKASSGGKNYVLVTKTATLTVNHVFDKEVVDPQYLKTAASEYNDAIYYKSCDCGEASTIETFTVAGTKLKALVANSSVASYEIVNQDAPDGYSTVTKGTVTYNNDDQGHTFLANVSIDEFSSVFFAFKTENRRFCNSNWEIELKKDEWYFVTIVKNNDSTFTSTVKDKDGTTKFGYENKNSFAEALLYYNWDGDSPNLVWYSTEVRGIRPEPVGAVVSASTVTPFETTTISAPAGYTSVIKGTTTYNDSDQGTAFLSNLDIHEYSSVFFAFKTGVRSFTNSVYAKKLNADEWYFVTVTNNGNGTYTSVVKDKTGTEKFSYENKNSFANSLPYYNWSGDGNLVWYSTEVRGNLL